MKNSKKNLVVAGTAIGFFTSPFLTIFFTTYILAMARSIPMISNMVEFIYLRPWIIIGMSSFTPILIALFVFSEKRRFMLLIALMLLFPTWVVGWFLYMWGACLAGYCI